MIHFLAIPYCLPHLLCIHLKSFIAVQSPSQQESSVQFLTVVSPKLGRLTRYTETRLSGSLWGQRFWSTQAAYGLYRSFHWKTENFSYWLTWAFMLYGSTALLNVSIFCILSSTGIYINNLWSLHHRLAIHDREVTAEVKRQFYTLRKTINFMSMSIFHKLYNSAQSQIY